MILSILTGVSIGAIAGIVTGEGMEVTLDEKGRKKLKRISLRKGCRKAWNNENIQPFLLAAMTFGTLVCAESLGEYGAAKMDETNEYYENKKDDLINRSDIIVDRLAEHKFEAKSKEYSEISNLTKNYDGYLSDIKIISTYDNKELNDFELYGLKYMEEHEIVDALQRSIEEDRVSTKEYLNNIIEDSYWWELDMIEDTIENLEEGLFQDRV